MSLGVKRVPLDFSWVLNSPWKGYQNPHDANRVSCTSCIEYPGFSAAMRSMRDRWHGRIAFDPKETDNTPYRESDRVIQEAVALGRMNATLRAELPQIDATILCEHLNIRWQYHLGTDDVDALWNAGLWQWPGTSRIGLPCVVESSVDERKPTPNEVNEIAITEATYADFIGSAVWTSACERAGVSTRCESCGGLGWQWPSANERVASLSWSRVDPPNGPAYQMWDEQSGAPVSPPMPDATVLADWMVREYVGRAYKRSTWLWLIEQAKVFPTFLVAMVDSSDASPPCPQMLES
ncbi:hypothetical protein [Paraburkholderia caribensis]|uniref:hypothetical protein n=1 Tax=Paraburkholderia caribensis TaxID=75105 RepID=UPI001CB54B6C|nr:hypothetical protein [Paraburkholderia caribensis]CAG9269799.1 conserved hypothetical protein [Paraburkholderia caribensis]